ncbi:MAG: family 20 glycosylhydrolase [Bacteroidales bacterium]|nr:family 20 glycosylhydrolase [Bacteroidales bacterium]
MMRINKLVMLASLLFTAVLPASAGFDFVPKPASVQYLDGETGFVLDKNVTITGGDLFTVQYLQEHIARVVDPAGDSWNPGKPGRIEFVRTKSFPEEGYSINVQNGRILITSTTRTGEFYAVQTLLQMFPPQVYRKASGPDAMLLRQWEIPAVEIVDQPRFAWRGSMFDVSRTFFDKEYILRHLDWLAYHKINKFHWHLTDDNGWRVEIKKYPKLTSVGAWRGYGEALEPSFNSGSERYGGFYTQEDLKEIVAYAADRCIEIIPEIDLPGHSKALAVSYPEVVCKHDADVLSVQGEVHNVLCVGREKNYAMLENIIKELAAIFPSKYFHVGVEEVATDSWKHCPDCQKLMKKLGYTDERQLLGYFTERLEKILAKYGKTLEGWEDIVAGESLSRNDLVLVWHRQNVLQKALDAGFPVVTQNCDYLYFDMKQTLAERGHSWASIIDVEKVYSFDPLQGLDLKPGQERQVKGLQGGLWTELLYYPAHFSEYQLFPRLCALAEVGWTPQPQREYADFNARLARTHFERMWNMGIRFRIPAPEVDPQGNVRCPYPNMVVRYTSDRSEPTVSSPVVTGPIVADHPENLRFATFFGDVKSMTVGVPGAQKYLKPAVKVTTSLEARESTPVSNLELYEHDKYMRTARAPKKGDYVLFTFEKPVSCKRITVQTADPKNNFYGITDGHVEVLFDEGPDKPDTWCEGASFDMYNQVTFFAALPVKAVKIVVDGSGEGKAVSIQHLIIE